MYNIERVNQTIMDIEKYFEELRKMNITKDNVDNSEKFFASSMVIFSILNETIDLATEIIIKNHWGMPADYKNYFQLLVKEGVISKELGEEMQKLMGDRNIFAHQYFDAGRKEMLHILKRVYFVKDFIEKIKKFIARENE